MNVQSSMGSITHDIVNVTPEMAATWLAASPGNRDVRKSRVLAYAADMTAGRWPVNGEPIIFDEEGRIMDGHHRLGAVVLAGVTVRLLVCRGVPRDAYQTIDGGLTRGPADRVGWPNKNKVMATIGVLLTMRNGVISRAFTQAERTDVYGYAESDLQWAANMRGTKGANSALTRAAAVVIRRVNAERADEFAQRMCTMALPAGSPEAALYRALEGRRWHFGDMCRIALRASVAAIRDEPVALLRPATPRDTTWCLDMAKMPLRVTQTNEPQAILRPAS